MVINHTTIYEGKKAFLKDRKPGLFVTFDKFPCPWIRIFIPNINSDPGPGQPNQCGSGSTTLLFIVVDIF
jgi:hypothetical protein